MSRTQRGRRWWTGALISAVLLVTPIRNGDAQPSPSPAVQESSTAIRATANSMALGSMGCPATQAKRTPVTLVNERHSGWYRLTERGLRLWNNRPISVVGGLLPTTNIAAQPDDLTYRAQSFLMPSQIGSTPFAPPKSRTIWVQSVANACQNP